jgi:hypothetical protein
MENKKRDRGRVKQEKVYLNNGVSRGSILSCYGFIFFGA